MKVQFELVIGASKFTLVEDVETHADFFKKLHFYSTLPKVGPNGETDLVLSYRVAQKQYEYYSIVSEKAGMEFKFGQSKESKGTLFSKGWEPLYKADSQEDGDDSMAQGNIGASASIQAPTQAPAPVAAQQRAAQPAPVAARAPATPTQAPMQVQTQAAAILSKFGI